MRIARSVTELREAVTGTGRVGLVPTMGALHAGHLALVSAARDACDTVVTSVFVNPIQFNDKADLAAYPRDEARDAHLAEQAGTDVLFLPTVEEMYPAGYATTVSVRGVSEPLEGAHRGASHFDGVATVVAKLLIAVSPHVAYFGQKDAQQVAVLRRLVADLGLPVEIAVCATVRDPDGLAMSSRNIRLGPEDRPRALALKAGLEAVAATLAEDPDARAAERVGTAAMRARGVEPEYLAVVDPDTFTPADDLSIPSLAVVAARVGAVRLIDNLPIPPVTARQEAR